MVFGNGINIVFWVIEAQLHVISANVYFKCCSGMPICEAFAQIEQQPNIYDVVHVKHFDEVFSIPLIDLMKKCTKLLAFVMDVEFPVQIFWS